MSVCGVLLFETAFTELGDAINPYVKEGHIGKYIYCSQAVQNGNFIDMTFEPAQINSSAKDRMLISIPTQFVKFMATGPKLPIGFTAELVL